MTISSINPATNRTIETFEPLTKDETLDRVARAHEAYRSWRKTSFEQRKHVILTLVGQNLNTKRPTMPFMLWCSYPFSRSMCLFLVHLLRFSHFVIEARHQNTSGSFAIERSADGRYCLGQHKSVVSLNVSSCLYQLC